MQDTRLVICSNKSCDALGCRRTIAEGVERICDEEVVIGWIEITVFGEYRILPNMGYVYTLLRYNEYSRTAIDAVYTCGCATILWKIVPYTRCESVLADPSNIQASHIVSVGRVHFRKSALKQ